MMKLAPYPFTLVTLLNANYADGIDTSWIWDADFELINALKVEHIITGGVRHSEMARRVRVSGFDENKISDSETLSDVLDLIEQQASDHVYILATYTAMLEMRDLLATRHYMNGEMK